MKAKSVLISPFSGFLIASDVGLVVLHVAHIPAEGKSIANMTFDQTYIGLPLTWWSGLEIWI